MSVSDAVIVVLKRKAALYAGLVFFLPDIIESCNNANI